MAWQMTMVPPVSDTKALRQRDHEVVAEKWLLSAPVPAVAEFAAAVDWKIRHLGIGYRSSEEGGVHHGVVASAELAVLVDLAVLDVVAAAADRELPQSLQGLAAVEEAAVVPLVLAEPGRDVQQQQHLEVATLTGKPVPALHLCCLADHWLLFDPVMAESRVLGLEQVQDLAGHLSSRRASPQASS